MKKREKTIKGEHTVDAGQLENIIALLNSTHDYELTSACLSLYNLLEKNEEKKFELLHHGDCLKKLIGLLDNECSNVKRFSCMAVASLSLNESVRKAIRKSNCPLTIKLLCLLKCEEDNILKENILLLLSSMANEISWKISISDEGGLTILLDYLQSEDPDIVKNSLHTLALVLQYWGAKVALYSCNNIHHIFGLMFSKHAIIKQLTIFVLIQAADYAPMQIVLGMRGIMEMILGCLLCSDDRGSLPHILHLLSKCLNIPNMIQEFCSLCGINSLLCLLNIQPENKEKIAIKKSINPKGKRDKQNLETEETISKDEFKLMQIQDPKDSLFECLQRIAGQSKFYRSLQRQNIDELLMSQLPELENSGKNLTTFLNLLGVLSCNIRSRLFFGERVNMFSKLILSHISSADTDALRAISLFLTNLTYECQKNCKLMASSGVEQILLTLLKSQNEEVLANTCRLMCNLSSCIESRLIISNEAVNQLIHLLKSQLPSSEIISKIQYDSNSNNLIMPFNKSCDLIERISLVLAYLSIDQNIKTLIFEGDVINLVVSLLACDQPNILRAASILVSRLATDPVTAEIIFNFCGLPKIYDLHKSRSKKNEFSDLALHKLYKLKPVEKFTFLGSLSYEDEIKDGFYDVGQINCNSSSFSSLKTLKNYLYNDCNGWRPVLVVNAKISKNDLIKLEENVKHTSINLRNSSNTYEYIPLVKEKQKKNLKRTETISQVETDVVETEIKIPDIPEDEELFNMIEKCCAEISVLPTTKHQVTALAKLVSDSMGGIILRDYLNDFNWQDHLSDLKKIGNLVPLGKIKYGIHFHRAVLFKVLADRINLCSKLNRGEYNRGFIEVILMEERNMLSSEYQKCVDQLVPERYIVDLLFQPGYLIPIDSMDAEIYTSF